MLTKNSIELKNHWKKTLSIWFDEDISKLEKVEDDNLEEYKEYKLRENIGLKKNLTGVELFDYHESEIFDDEIQSFDIDVSEIEDLKIQISDMYEKYYDELIELYR